MRGQSETTGVLFVVALALIMAAIVAGSVFDISALGLSETPQASFSYDYDEPAEDLTVTFEGGNKIQGDLIQFRRVDGGGDLDDPTDWSSETDVTSGESIVLSPVPPTAEIQIRYVEKREGGNTAVLDTWEGPDA